MFRWGNDKFSHLGYKLFTIFYCKWFDFYIFKYSPGSYIPKHKDPGRWHYRLNFIFGGNAKFVCRNALINRKHITLFRADKYYHRTTPTDSTRYVISFGFKL